MTLASEMGKRSHKVQLKKWGDKYGDEMRRRAKKGGWKKGVLRKKK